MTKKRLARPKAAKAARGSESSESSMWKEMRDDALAKGNQGMTDMGEQMMRTSVKSPAVMQPSFGDVGGPFVSQQTGGNTANGATGNNNASSATGNTGIGMTVKSGNDTTVSSGGIGMVNGKVIFGPPRPPSIP